MISVSTKKIFSLLLLFFLINTLNAQEQSRKYDVFHNGNIVGQINFYQNRSGESLYLKMVSDIKVRVMVDISVKITEESHFLQGKLIQSRLHRTVNGKEKANRQTNAAGNVYHTLAEGKKGILSLPRIDYNLIQLYSMEPLNRSRVYSDNFQKFLPIKAISTHVYRVDLPDGNYNEYTYTKGICTNVFIHSSLFTIELKLV